MNPWHKTIQLWQRFAGGKAWRLPEQVVEFVDGPWDGVQVLVRQPYRSRLGVPTIPPEIDSQHRIHLPEEPLVTLARAVLGPHVYSRHEVAGRFVYRYEGRLPPGVHPVERV